MLNYIETEEALKELLQNIETVPGTFPPVYTCDGFVIGYDRQGKVKILGSTKTEERSSQTVVPPKRQTGWLGSDTAAETPEPTHIGWLNRLTVRTGRLVKMIALVGSLGIFLSSYR
jgi:hypothetical protein